MRTEKTLLRLGGVVVAAAVVTALVPAVAGHAAGAPAPSASATPAASGTASPSASSSARPTTTTSAAPVVPSGASPSLSASAPAKRVTPTPTASAARTSSTPAPRATAAAASAPKAAGWLVSQLVDGDHLLYPGSTYADDGDASDVAFSLAATGTQDASLVKIVRYLESDAGDYADPKGTAGGPNGGALGKLALVAEATGQDPHDFGGYDLLGTLTSSVCTAAIAGQYTPCTAAGDFHNAYSGTGQALAVLALERAGVTVPPSALARLLSLQCPDGGFSSDLITTGDPCTSDADTTGFAEQALVLDPAATAQVQAASQYLLGSQLADGGWYGASSTSATDGNANSTALAVEALIAAPAVTTVRSRVADAAAVTDGQAFLGTLQHTDGALQVSPATTPPADNLIATDQSVPAIVGDSLTTLLHPVSLAVTTTSPTVAPTSTSAAPTVTPTTPVASLSNGPTAGGTLPFTGTDAALWSELAAALLVVGAGLLFGGTVLRRRGAHR